MGTYIGIASSNGQTFTNARQDDFILYAQRPSRLLFGTQSNVKSKIQINSNAITLSENTVIEGRVQVNNVLAVTGLTAIYGDLFVAGNLITSQDLVMDGYQIANGASYCNGDLFVVNDTVGEAFSNANVYVESISGVPIIHLRQTDPSYSNEPFTISQKLNGDGYITNTKNIYVGTNSNLTFLTFTSNSSVGINTTAPKATLDIRNGDINARNHVQKVVSASSSNPLDVVVNWETPSLGAHNCIMVETTQQLNSPVKQGTRIQKHKLLLGDPYHLVSQVAYAVGDMESYTSLHISASNLSSNSVRIISHVRDPGTVATSSNLIHELGLEVLVAPHTLGHIWLT
jgi:hypothetical protein